MDYLKFLCLHCVVIVVLHCCTIIWYLADQPQVWEIKSLLLSLSLSLS